MTEIKSKKNEGESSVPEGIDKLANIFPEIYYDIIARAVPGSIVIVLCIWISSSNHKLTKDIIFSAISSTSWSHVFFIVFGGYLVGFSCAKIWDMIIVFLAILYFITSSFVNKISNLLEEVISKKIVKINSTLPPTRWSSKSKSILSALIFHNKLPKIALSLKKQFYIPPLELDRTINSKNRKSSESQVLTKILAETALFQNCFIGWIGLNIVYEEKLNTACIREILSVPIFNYSGSISVFLLLCVLHHYGVLASRINSFDAQYNPREIWRNL